MSIKRCERAGSWARRVRIKLLMALMLIPLICAEAMAGLGGDFTLTDQNGKPFHLQQLRNNVVLLYFGYTSCPDVCPIEIGKMSSVQKYFSERHEDRIWGLFVSIDPERDSQQRLKQYLNYFGDKILGLTGTRQEIDQVVHQYMANYRIQKQGDDVTVEHSSNLYVINQEGEVVTMVPFGMSAAHVAKLVEGLLDSPPGEMADE
jgi:protein SCO1